MRSNAGEGEDGAVNSNARGREELLCIAMETKGGRFHEDMGI